MNTRFEYLYRDTDNYKTWHTVIVSGRLNAAQIRSCLHEDDFFLPVQVGLNALQPDPATVRDHIWHEVGEINETEDPPTIKLTAQELLRAFQTAKQQGWDEMGAMKRMGMV